jgi:hypothetical protein
VSGYDASEWEPGDVASLTIVGRAGTKQVAAMRGKDGWYYPTPSGFASNFDSASTVIDARRLVVIDPEDAEQVARLRDLLLDGVGLLGIDGIAAALREYANPARPIDEPQGLGAVVNDRDGDVWVKHRNGSWSCLMGPVGADVRTWDELCGQYGPISEGVTS